MTRTQRLFCTTSCRCQGQRKGSLLQGKGAPSGPVRLVEGEVGLWPWFQAGGSSWVMLVSIWSECWSVVYCQGLIW